MARSPVRVRLTSQLWKAVTNAPRCLEIMGGKTSTCIQCNQLQCFNSKFFVVSQSQPALRTLPTSPWLRPSTTQLPSSTIPWNRETPIESGAFPSLDLRCKIFHGKTQFVKKFSECHRRAVSIAFMSAVPPGPDVFDGAIAAVEAAVVVGSRAPDKH